MKKHTKIKTNFKYPRLKHSDRNFGVSLGEVIREDGNWLDFLPPFEEQRQNGVESASCYIGASQNAVSVIQEEQHGVKDQNYSARFNALLSGGTENGGDPVRGAKSIKFDGLVPEELMSFKDITSWTKYHSWFGVDEKSLRQKGQEFLDKWSLNFKILFEKDMPLKTKYSDLKEALKRSPVPLSVCAWYESNGEYYKPQGKRDNHFVLALFVDEKDRIHILDTYAPNLKILAPNTNPEFALTWVVTKKSYEEQLSIIGKILALIGKLIPQLAPKLQETPKPSPEPVLPQPEPLKWDKENARHSIRVICDEYHLTWVEKDLICAVIQAESGFDIKAVGAPNKDGTRDYGLCQINDYWWIGKDKYFASVDEVLNNPEKSVRFMIEQFKLGHINYWVAFTSGAYRKYL